MNYIKRYTIKDSELKEISELIDAVKQQYKFVEDKNFLVQTGLIAQQLPYNLRSFLHDYKQYEDTYPVCIISGYQTNDTKIGKTPKHWREKAENYRTLDEDIFFILCSSIIGYPIAWATQQDGYIIHEVLPIKEHENDQLGFSSKEYLEWHTEDAFHPLRADYLGLMCIRNPTNTPTLISSNTEMDFTKEIFKPLFKKKFKIKPDNSHMQKTYNTTTSVLRKANKSILELNNRPPSISVLFGNKKSPFWRIDPYFMETPKDELSKRALESIISEINTNLKGVILNPGDIFFCDNYRVVHGRPSFVAKYDGWDRWLKRLNISIDLRKSRAARECGTSRVIF